jgi:hypothetical protein
MAVASFDQQKQPLRRAVRMLDGERGEIVEQTFEAGELGDQHHADEEEIDVDALLDAGKRAAPRQQAEQHQRGGPRQCPDRLGQAKRPNDDACGRKPNDAPGPKGVMRRGRQSRSLLSSGPRNGCQPRA